MPSLLRRGTGTTRQLRAPSEAWLGRHQEIAIDAARPIIDSHHHLFDRDYRYLFDEFLKDTQSGHNIRGSVFVECGSMYKADASEIEAPIGEVEFVNGVAAMSASGKYGDARLCAGIVGFADLTVGAHVADVLDKQMASSDRFRGIRLSAVWDPDERMRAGRLMIPRGMLNDGGFREGFSKLVERNLSYDTWIFFPQLDEVIALADAFPSAILILNHIGGLILGAEAYSSAREEAVALWKTKMPELAKRKNIYVKLGGLGMPVYGYPFHKDPMPPTSDLLAKAWSAHINACIDWFGPQRCMFESNFPPDKQSCSYTVIWNAFKKIAASLSESEKDALFFATAAEAYRLNLGR